MKSKKTLFILGAVFTLFSAMFIVATLALLFANTDFTPYALQNALIELGINEFTIEDIIKTFNYLKIVFIFNLLFLVFIIFVSFNAAFKKPEKINKTILVTAIVISWLFNNLIASILLTVGYFSNAKVETVRNHKSGMTKEIESIRNLYKQGAITKEEYDRLVNELFNKIEFNQ